MTLYWDMGMGLILIILTGLAWGGIGVVLGMAARRRFDVLPFITIATVVSCIVVGVFFVRWPVLMAGPVDRLLPLTLVLAGAGVAGVSGMMAMQKAMTAGAAAWTVGQSAMVIPYLAGILFLGDPLRPGGVLGVLLIMLSLASFFKDSQRSRVGGMGWFRFALLAFVLLGVQQTLSSLPSSWDGWSDAANLRPPLVLLAGAIPLTLLVILRARPIDRRMVGLALGYAVFIISGQVLLFRAMDCLRVEGRLSLAFPVALGTCIIFVSLWDIIVLRSGFSRLTLLGIVLGAAGVIMMALA